MSLLGSVLGGSVVVALINSRNDKWKFKAERDAEKEDRAAEKADKVSEMCRLVAELQESTSQTKEDVDKRFDSLFRMQEAQSEALKMILLDLILQKGREFTDEGRISFDDRKRFNAMHAIYHNGLKGNGDADFIVGAVNELPLK